jgi:hypothetical protein
MGVWACERNRRRRWRLFGKHLPRQRRLPYETSLRPYVPTSLRPYVPTPRRPHAHTLPLPSSADLKDRAGGVRSGV